MAHRVSAQGPSAALSALGVRCFVFDRNEAGAKEVAAEVGGVGIGGDVTDPERLPARRRRGRRWRAIFGVAVNCAGTGWVGRVVNRDGTPHDLNAFQTILQINTIGTFNVMTRAAAAMATTEPLEDGERGVIVNTASVAAFDGQIGQLAYSASKGAVVGMTLPAARDLSRGRHPGGDDRARDSSTLHFSECSRRSSATSSASPCCSRSASAIPDQYGQLVVQIAQNSYLNGEVIRLDGGIRMPPK